MGDMIQTIPDYAVEQARRTLRNTASVLKPRRLWSFDITGVVEVEADDEELGIDAMRRERLSRVDYQCTDSREVAYQDFVPAPWDIGAKACRFAPDKYRMRAVKVEGEEHWWATNGHMAVRCNTGLPPGISGVVVKYLSADEWAMVVVPSQRRQRVEAWFARGHTFNGEVLATLAAAGCVAAKAEYVMLVESSGLCARWEACPLGERGPHLAYDSMGQLLALVHGYTESGEHVDCDVAVVLEEVRRKAAAMRAGEPCSS